MIRMEFKTEVLSAAEEKSIEKAAALLQKGELVALPTETVYAVSYTHLTLPTNSLV